MIALGAATALPAQGLADLPLPRHGRALLFSSADPAGSNEDHTHCLRRLPDGRCVLAEAGGPGRIARIWSANPAGELRIEVDGTTVFAAPFEHLFDGSVAPFEAPLAMQYAGGALCHVPIPFRHRVLVTASPAAGRYHQITVLQQHEAEPFVLPPGPRLAAELRALATAPAAGGELVVLTGLPVRDGLAIAALPGSGEVLEMRARLRHGDARRWWLQVHCDGERLPCLLAPLDLLLPADLACQVTGMTGGLPGLRLPMPFRRGLRLLLAGPAAADEGAALDLLLRWRRLPADHGRRYLHGAVHRGINRHGLPATLLDVAGTGHLAGVVARLCGAPGQGLSFLEGDERVLADGRPWQGTGTEDFFSGAWYFRGAPQGSPFAAVGTVDPRRALVRCARFFVADPVPFSSSLRIQLEHGGGNDTPGSVYDALVLWYDDAPRGRTAAPGAPPPDPPPQWLELRAADRWPELAPDGGTVAWPPDRQPPAPPAGEAWTLLAGDTPVDPAATPLRFDRVRAEPVLPALRHWRVFGPFPCPERQGLDLVAVPALDTGGIEVETRADGILDLRRLFPRDRVVAFAVTDFELDRDGDCVLVLGSDDAVRAFVDGRAVHQFRGLRGVGRDQDRVPLRLGAGRHRLVLQVENYRGGFACHARIEADP